MKKASNKDMELFSEKFAKAASILDEAVELIGCDTFVKWVHKSPSGDIWDLIFEKRKE